MSNIIDRLFEIALENDTVIEARPLTPPVESVVIQMSNGRRFIHVDMREDGDDERLARALIRALAVTASLDYYPTLKDLPDVIPWEIRCIIRGEALDREAEYRANLIRRQLEGITC